MTWVMTWQKTKSGSTCYLGAMPIAEFKFYTKVNGQWQVIVHTLASSQVYANMSEALRAFHASLKESPK